MVGSLAVSQACFVGLDRGEMSALGSVCGAERAMYETKSAPVIACHPGRLAFGVEIPVDRDYSWVHGKSQNVRCWNKSHQNRICKVLFGDREGGSRPTVRARIDYVCTCLEPWCWYRSESATFVRRLGVTTVDA